MEQVRIIAENRGICRLLTSQGEITARLAPRIYEETQPVTGDWAFYDPAAGMVTALAPRRTVLTRKRAGRPLEEQVLAANVDVASWSAAWMATSTCAAWSATWCWCAMPAWSRC